MFWSLLLSRCRRKSNAAQKESLRLISVGNLLEDSGQFSEAMLCYEAALELAPTLARAQLSRGNIFAATGRFQEALTAYDEALVICPDYASAFYNAGNVHLKLGCPNEALLAYDKALKLIPDFLDATVARGLALSDCGRNEEAAESYRQALTIQPDYIGAHINLGNVLRTLGKYQAAVECLRKSIELDPDDSRAHNNLGNVMMDMGNFDKAENCYRKALVSNPAYVEAHINLGNVLLERGQTSQAVSTFQRALTLGPTIAETHNNLGNALLRLGQFGVAETCYLTAIKCRPNYFEAHSNLLFSRNFRDIGPPRLAEARAFGQLVAQVATAQTAWENEPDPYRQLRIGFVSGDFCSHPVGFFLESVFAALSASPLNRLTLYAFHNHFRCDEITTRLKEHCHFWRSVAGKTDAQLVQCVREDQIDILIDLSGHTAHNRLTMFAWKPAPLQVTWLGYFATTGVSAIDYLIADHWCLPISEEMYFTESIIRLPETRFCFTPPAVELDITVLPALTNGFVTYACFNSLSKLSEDVLELWAKVLDATPGSRLLLKSQQLSEKLTQHAIYERFAFLGIDGSRLILEEASPRSEYLAAYQRVDIALDPFPFTGGTTTVEALWMGVPVITLSGEHLVARQGVGILSSVGMQDWIAQTPEGYVALAVKHAHSLQALSMLRQGLRSSVMSSPLFDAPRFARHFSAALIDIWVKWCATKK